MKIQDIIELTKAGFTKEEIVELSKSGLIDEEKPEPKTEPEPRPEPEPEPEPKTEPEKKENSYTFTDSQLQQLIQGVSVKTSGGVVSMPPNINDKLGEHFNSLMKGE